MPTSADILFSAPNIEEVKAQVLGLIPIFDRVASAMRGSSSRAARDGSRAYGDAAKQTARDAERAAKDLDRIDKQAAKEKQSAVKETFREIERSIKDEQRVRNANNTFEVREWQRKEREKTREEQSESNKRKALATQEARAAEATIKARSRGFGNLVGGASGRVMGMAGAVAGVATAVGGGFAIADALRSGIESEKTAGVIFRGAAEKGNFKTSKEVESLASGAAISTGTTKQDVLGGIDMFVRKTGDLKAAEDMTAKLAKLSSASGAEFTDIGSTSAEIFNQLGNSKDTMSVMRALVGQGMAGAIDIKDLGQYGGRLAASAATFSGPLAGNIESFGAIAQLAKKFGGATDPAEATEAVARIGSDMAKHADAFQGIGVDVFADKNKTKFRSAEDVITESVVKSKGDLTVLKELFGERSFKAALGAQVAFSNAGGGTAGESAIREQFRTLKSNTPTEDDIEAKNREHLAETGAKLNNALTQFNDAINSKLMPVIPGLVDEFTKVIPSLATMTEAIARSVVPAIKEIAPVVELFAHSMTSHPWATLIGAAFTAEIAKAAIGSAITGGATSLAAKVLGLFAGQKAAVANIQAGVVNVGGAAGVGKTVADVVKTVTGAGAGAEAAAIGGGAESAGGFGAGALGLLSVPLAFGAVAAGGVAGLGLKFHQDRKRTDAAEQDFQRIMALPESTTEEQQAKITSLKDIEHKGRSGQRFHELALRGEQDDETKFSRGNSERLEGMDAASQAFAKHLEAVSLKLESVSNALAGAAPRVAAFSDALKPPAGADRKEVPSPYDNPDH